MLFCQNRNSKVPNVLILQPRWYCINSLYYIFRRINRSCKQTNSKPEESSYRCCLNHLWTFQSKKCMMYPVLNEKLVPNPHVDTAIFVRKIPKNQGFLVKNASNALVKPFYAFFIIGPQWSKIWVRVTFLRHVFRIKIRGISFNAGQRLTKIFDIKIFTRRL